MRPLPVALMFIALTVSTSARAAPTVSNVTVVDVTAGSFSLAFTASEPVVPTVRVTTDAAGAQEVAGLSMDALPGAAPAVAQAARAAGIWLIRLGGLRAGTVYHYQLRARSVADGTETTQPPNGTLPSVEMEAGIEPVQAPNDQWLPARSPLLRHDLALLGTPAPTGALVTAEWSGGSAAVSAWLGNDGSNLGTLDFNNFFSAQTRQIGRASAGDVVKVRVISALGVVTRAWKVPALSPAGGVVVAQPFTQSVSLVAGWNLVSLQVEPADRTLATLFGAQFPSVAEVWSQTASGWEYYDRANPGGTLNALTVQQGYWVRCTAPATMSLSGGWAVDPVPLQSGWNLVGYRALGGTAIETATTTLTGAIRTVWTWDASSQTWRVWRPGIPPGISDLLFVDAGSGYMLDMVSGRAW